MQDSIAAVRQVLQRFQDGYSARDFAQLDAFMDLFVAGDEPELIGIGAVARNQNEWFEGAPRIREIIESDWTYWGDVRLDVQAARITILSSPRCWYSKRTSGASTPFTGPCPWIEAQRRKR